jgi:hypothetical protein
MSHHIFSSSKTTLAEKELKYGKPWLPVRRNVRYRPTFHQSIRLVRNGKETYRTQWKMEYGKCPNCYMLGSMGQVEQMLRLTEKTLKESVRLLNHRGNELWGTRWWDWHVFQCEHNRSQLDRLSFTTRRLVGRVIFFSCRNDRLNNQSHG